MLTRWATSLPNYGAKEKCPRRDSVEEEAFNKTLDRGIALFEEEVNKLLERHDRQISGAFAFKLYDEQGFPLDLTELMARERGLTVDTAGFEKLMEEQRARARAAQKKEVIALSQIATTTPTHFWATNMPTSGRTCRR